MSDPHEDRLREEMERMSRAVRPTARAAGTVHAGVRRSRRRRTAGAVVGTAGLVAAVAVAGSALAGSGAGGDRRTTEPDVAASSPSSSPSAVAGAGCSTEVAAPRRSTTLADLAEQQRVVRRLLEMSSVQVRHAAPTPLGVVALVVDDGGDLDHFADPEVVERLRTAGAAHVYEWDPAAAGTGVDADGQVRQVLQWLLGPALADVRRATRDLPGDAGPVVAPEVGAVVVRWKRPAPPQVQALAGVRPDGVEVLVEEVAHSRDDIRQAQRRLEVVLVERGLREDWSSASPCGDGSGLVVGMVPPIADRAALEADLTDALGLPVTVVPEQRPVPLVG